MVGGGGPPLPIGIGRLWLLIAVVALFGANMVAGDDPKPPVIFLHGILGSKLYITGKNIKYPSGKDLENCKTEFPWKKVWVSTDLLLDTNCLIHQMKLYYNLSTGQYENLPGITVSVTKEGKTWGYDTDSVSCMFTDDLKIRWGSIVQTHPSAATLLSFIICEANKILRVATSDVYAASLMEFLMTGAGYDLRVGDGIYIASYDWRHNYNSEAFSPYYSKLTNLIEHVVGIHKRKVTFIAHSMGNLVLAHFLQMKDNDWLKKYVHGTVNVAPPYGGTVLMMDMLKNATNWMGIENALFRAIQQKVLSDKYVNYFLRSIPSAATLLPRKNGFGKRELARSLEFRRNFGADEMPQYLHYVDLPEMVDIYRSTEEVKFPAEPSIEMRCFFSKTDEDKTPVAYVYTGSGKRFFTNGEGDERVNIDSMRNPCNKFKREREEMKERGVENVKEVIVEQFKADHLGILGQINIHMQIRQVLSNAMADESPRRKVLKRMLKKGRMAVMRGGGLEEAGRAASKLPKMKPQLVDLKMFFQNLPEYRENIFGDHDKQGPAHRWEINHDYDARGWNQLIARDEFGLAKLLDVARHSARETGRKLVRLEKPGELAFPAVNGEWNQQEEENDEKIDAQISMRPDGRQWLTDGMKMMVRDMETHLDNTLRLFPLAILPPATNEMEEEGGEANEEAEDEENEAEEEDEERRKQMKFLILGVAERGEETKGNNLDEIIKKNDHLLLEFVDPRLGMDAMETPASKMLPKIDPEQIPTLLESTLNLPSVVFLAAPKDAKWTEAMIGSGVDKEEDKKVVAANLNRVVSEFVRLVKGKWPMKRKGGGDAGGDGQRNKTREEELTEKAERFALVREELTGRKLATTLKREFGEGMMASLRQKWQAKVPFVRFKEALVDDMEELGWNIKGTLAKLLSPSPPFGGSSDAVAASPLRLASIATIGNDSALFIVLSPQLEGVLRVDDLNEYFKRKRTIH